MNKRLIEDEGSRKPMSVDELRQRMNGWLRGDWTVDLLLEEGAIVGYVVYQLRQDEYDQDKTVVYVRQFYIERDQRNRGLGSAAFKALAQSRFPAECTIVLEVLATNPRSYSFWRKVGFQPYCTTMKLERSHCREKR